MNEKVLVMMSTYNGEEYIKEQLDSVLNQKNVDVVLLIRDDGSSDATLEILEDYSKKYTNVSYYCGENLKPAKSFFDLVNRAQDMYEYYAFCDQDDVWDLRKLEKGISKIKEQEKDAPVLYFCESEVVDEKLAKIGKTERNIDFVNSIQDVMFSLGDIPGCAMLLNKRLFLELRKYSPKYMSMHDKWIHLVCLAINGVVVKDDETYMKYRRVANHNVTGKQTIFGRFRKLLNLILTDDKCMYSRQVSELLENYSNEMNKEQIEFAKTIINYKKSLISKIKLLLYKNKYISKGERINMKFRMLLGIF